MANLLNQLTIDNVNYDLYDSEFIIDTRTASGAALTGVSHAPELFDGMQITYWLNYAAASNATLNLTLADGTTTGAIPCYYSGTTRLGTNYAAGNAIRFIYRENVTIGSTTIAAGWWSDANYTVSDTNYDIIGTSIPIKTRLNAYCLCAMVDTNGTIAKQTNTAGAGTYWQINAFTQSSGTGTSKKLVPNQGYYPGKIFYYTGSSAITDASSVSGTISGGTSNVDLRYTVNGSTSANIGVTGAPFFFVGSLGSDGLFYPNGHASEATKEWWQCGFPTDLTSTYVYWYVGMMSSKYQCRLSDTNWMLKSDGTKWIVFDGASKVYWDSIEGKPSTFTPASHTHGYISNNGAIADSMATTPASGDKIVITDSSDSNKVKGAITIGSDDGKFLKHDGTWDTLNSGPDTPDAPTTDGNYVLNVNSGNSSWQEEEKEVFNIMAMPASDYQFYTNVSYTDFTAAKTAKKIIQIAVPYMNMSGILCSKSGSDYIFNMYSNDLYNGLPCLYVFKMSEAEDESLLITAIQIGQTISTDLPSLTPSTSGGHVLYGSAGGTYHWTAVNIDDASSVSLSNGLLSFSHVAVLNYD